MTFKTGSGIMLILLVVGMLTFTLNIQPATATPPVHNIDTGLDYATIQEALDANETASGHTIFVEEGVYKENIAIKESLTLTGENRSTTVIDGSGTGNVITIDITAHRVNITGFTIRNGTNGIFINTTDYNSISGNIVTDNQNGVQLFATCTCNPASENTIRNNIIANNTVGVHVRTSKNNAIYHNSFMNNTDQTYLYNSPNNAWNNGYPSGGNYWSDYTGADLYSGHHQNESGSDGIGDTPYLMDENNEAHYPLMIPYPSIHAIGVGDIRGKTVIGQGITTNLDVDIDNQGHYTEDFNLTIRINTTIIAAFTDITLTSGNSTTITVTWNTTSVSYGNYIISANATPVPNESYLGDNTKTGTLKVTMPGDVAPDFGAVNIVDMVYVAIHFDAEKGEPDYEPNADINEDDTINVIDIVIAALNFDKTYPWP